MASPASKYRKTYLNRSSAPIPARTARWRKAQEKRRKITSAIEKSRAQNTGSSATEDDLQSLDVSMETEGVEVSRSDRKHDVESESTGSSDFTESSDHDASTKSSHPTESSASDSLASTTDECSSESTDSDSASSDDHEENPDGSCFDFNDDVPLYPEARVSKTAVCVLVMMIGIHFGLTTECLGMLITLLKVVLPKRNTLPATLYALKEHLTGIFKVQSPTVHRYCSFCKRFIIGGAEQCSREKCKKNKAKSRTFVSLDIERQLQTILSGK